MSKIRKEIFEVHKPSALIAVEYNAPIDKTGKIKGYEHYDLTPVQHDALNFMCYKAWESINKKLKLKPKAAAVSAFETEDALMEFLEIQQFDLNLKELSEFTGTYKRKQNKKELSNILDSLQAVRVRVGLFKKDKIRGDIHATKTMSLLRNYTKTTNSTVATFQLEPEILIGWVNKTKPFSKMYLKIQTTLKLTYSKILYEVCKDYENQKIVEKEFSEWLKVLNFNSELSAAKTVSQLKQTYLNKAIKEINDNTDIFIENIEGKKSNGEVTMIVTFKNQECDLITVEKSITDHPLYSKSKTKLDKRKKDGRSPVIDEDAWIATDISRNKERYEAEKKIDKWLKETEKEFRIAIFEMISDQIEGCEDIIVFIDDYRIKGIDSRKAFTNTAIKTIEQINLALECVNLYISEN
jgi:plasmid replication initiation protein